MSFRNYCQVSDMPKSCHNIRAIYWTRDMISKSRKIDIILFRQVFQKQMLRNRLIYIVNFPYKKIWKEIWYTFLKYEFQKLLLINRHPKIMSSYHGSVLNIWHDFQCSQIGNIFFHQVFQKWIQRNTRFFIVFFFQKKKTR